MNVLKQDVSKLNVLVIGYGKMGKVHVNHLRELGCQTFWYDPYQEGGLDCIDDVSNFSHIVIASATHTHADWLRFLQDFQGNILVEKPAVTHIDDIHLLKRKSGFMFYGMCERYNPAFVKLNNMLPELMMDRSMPKKLEFIRHGETPKDGDLLMDLAIHDVDLLIQLLPGIKFDPVEFFFQETANEVILTHSGYNITIRAIRGDGPRKILVNPIAKEQWNTIEVDLRNQIFNTIQMPFVQTVKCELLEFLDGYDFNAIKAHEFCLSLRSKGK